MLAAGALLVALTSISPLAWIAVACYYAAVLAVAAQDAQRLPGSRTFSVERVIPRPFSMGARQTVELKIRNPEAAGLAVEVADHAPIDLLPEPRVLRGRFDAGGSVNLRYVTEARRRGAYHFTGVDLRCWRPRRWWLRQVRVPLPDEASVYPNVLAIQRYQLSLRRGLHVVAGQRRMRPPGATTAFSGLREYLPGDDIRRISWKTTARRDAPVTIEVEAERGQQLILAIDCGRLMTAPAGLLTKLDHAINAALLLAWVAQSQGDRVGMMTFSDGVQRFVAPQPGVAQTNLLNRVLYDVRADYSEPDFVDAFAHLSRRVSRRSLVIVLTDVLDPEASNDLVAGALRLGARHLVLVVAMSDPDLLAARTAPIGRSDRAYQWAAAEELLAARSQSFEALRLGGVLGMDVPAGTLSPALVERYLELKERALL